MVDESNTAGVAVAAATAGSPAHDVLTLTGGAIGYGMPAAVGAAIGAPGRPVLSLQADGSAMYTISALWTQAREHLDVTTVIFNNGAYDILRIELQRVGATADSAPGPRALDLLDIGRPAIDFVKIAEGMGVPARRATTAEELTSALIDAFAEPGPHLIDAVIPSLARLICPICSRPWTPSRSTVADMETTLTSAAIEIVPSDLQRSLDFYRLLGLADPGRRGS